MSNVSSSKIDKCGYIRLYSRWSYFFILLQCLHVFTIISYTFEVSFPFISFVNIQHLTSFIPFIPATLGGVIASHFASKSSFNVYSTNDGFAQESHLSKNFPCFLSDCDGSGYRRKNSASLQRKEAVLHYLLFMKFFRRRPLLENCFGVLNTKAPIFAAIYAACFMCAIPNHLFSGVTKKSSVSLHWHFFIVFCCHASRSFHLIFKVFGHLSFVGFEIFCFQICCCQKLRTHI